MLVVGRRLPLPDQNGRSILPPMTTPPGATAPPRRVRQELDLVIVAADGTRAPVVGRVVQLVDGRWCLSVPVAGGVAEARGDRHDGSRAAALLLLRAGASRG